MTVQEPFHQFCVLLPIQFMSSVILKTKAVILCLLNLYMIYAQGRLFQTSQKATTCMLTLRKKPFWENNIFHYSFDQPQTLHFVEEDS